MKQHITVEQLKELDNDKAKMGKLINPLLEEMDFLPLGEKYEYFADKITIGKIIEILDSALIEKHVLINKPLKQNGKWLVNLVSEDIDHANCKKFYSYELCDALWDAVKETL